MPPFSVLGIGAAYEDIVLTVPYFPSEDSKLRATSRNTRLGGNVPNTLGVLSQILVERYPENDPTLCFMGALGDEQSSSFLKRELERRHISLCVVNRTDCKDPPTSYILGSTAAHTRTIISYNEVSDLSLVEITGLIQNIKFATPRGRLETRPTPSWVHANGRNCEVLHHALSNIHAYLRREQDGGKLWDGVVSIDFERPGREGLKELFGLADVVFVSKIYATFIATLGGAHSETSDIDMVGIFCANVKELKKSAVCYITFGSDGCYVLLHEESERLRDSHLSWTCLRGCGWCCVHIKASDEVSPELVVETTGAGDTFIAAVIFGLGAMSLDPVQAGKLGNSVAGRKCLQEGYEGVWKTVIV